MNTNKLHSHWSRLSKKEIIELQNKKLSHYIQKTVLPFSAYYQKLFKEHKINPNSIRSIEDLQRIPFTSKNDLVNTPEHPQRSKEFILIPDQKILKRRFSTLTKAILLGKKQVQKDFEKEFRPIFMTSTTGRSAEPVPFLYTQHDLNNLSLSGLRAMQVTEAQKDYRILNMFPYAPHLAFWQVHYACEAFGVFIMSSGGGKVMGTSGNIRLLHKINPEVLIGIPTFVYHVLHQAIDEGIKCSSIKKIVLGGEKVESGMRLKLRYLADKLGSKNVDVLATYGFTEAKMALCESPFPSNQESAGYNVYPDLGLFEVIDPDTEEVLPEGESGELVYTPLDSRGSVVIRYRTGDIIEKGLTYEPCPYTGRCCPRLVGKISRVSNIKEMNLNKIKGTLVDFNQLEHVLENMEHIGAWQLELRKINDDPMELDELILHVEPTDRYDRKKLTDNLNRRFREQTELLPNEINFHNHREMQKLQGVGVQLKEQKIVDHRPDSNGDLPDEWRRHSKPGLLKRLINSILHRDSGKNNSQNGNTALHG